MENLIKNRTIFCGDNLEVLRGINTASVDLIYLDPPFNKNKNFIAPLGGIIPEKTMFADIFKKEHVKDEWVDIISETNKPLADYLNGVTKIGYSYNKYYLSYMAIRLLEMHRIVKATGSIYLHCDPTIVALFECTLRW